MGRLNMIARNINNSIQNCKTENQSQASLCCQSKLVSDLVQASNGYNFGRDSDASTSDFFPFFLFFFYYSLLVRLFFSFSLFLCTCCLFVLIFFLLQSKSAAGKGCKKKRRNKNIRDTNRKKISSFPFLMRPDLNNKGIRPQNNLILAIMVRTKI